MKSFKGLPHRFEIFLNKKNIAFINDSKTTSFRATQSALSSLKNIYWIVGGLPKKGDKIKLSKLKKNISKCYLIGKNTNFFKRQLQNKLFFAETKTLKNSIINIFRDIKPFKNSNKNILLSPAAASFDQFSNFEDREMNLKSCVRNMLKSSYKFYFINYWRNIDKKILFSFLVLFFLGLFFFIFLNIFFSRRKIK